MKIIHAELTIIDLPHMIRTISLVHNGGITIIARGAVEVRRLFQNEWLLVEGGPSNLWNYASHGT